VAAKKVEVSRAAVEVKAVLVAVKKAAPVVAKKVEVSRAAVEVKAVLVAVKKAAPVVAVRADSRVVLAAAAVVNRAAVANYLPNFFGRGVS
jgi:hypothetical protein